MNAEQFKELIGCLNDIASRLEDLESAVSNNDYGIYTIDDVASRLDDIKSELSDINHKQGDYCAYDLEDVVKALWDVERAVGSRR